MNTEEPSGDGAMTNGASTKVAAVVTEPLQGSMESEAKRDQKCDW